MPKRDEFLKIHLFLFNILFWGMFWGTPWSAEKFATGVPKNTLINFAKYKLVMFAMAKLMEMESIEQNKVALYLFNNVN